MMAAEQPILLSIIARLDEAKYNLAAFGIAFAFALIVEAPVIMLMSASTALVKNRDSYIKLRRFTDILNVPVTAIQLVVLIPSVFNFIVMKQMGVPENVARLSHASLALLLPWASSIGYRRFYQGILIRNNMTRKVTYGTMVRLSLISLAGISFYFMGIKGSYLGAATLSIAVFGEAVTTRLMASGVVKRILADSDGEKVRDNNIKESQLTYKGIVSFYYPLALTSILSLGVQPFVTFFLGRSNMAIESLAVLPVVNSLVFIFRSMGLSFQEVNIALIGDQKQNHRPLRGFAIILGTAVTILLAVIAFTPLAELWFSKVSGLSPELSRLSYLPLKISLLLPALSVLLSYQRSLMVIGKNTGPISTATAIELVVIIIVLLITVVYLDLIGVVAACLAFVIGKALANAYLVPRQRAVVASWKEK